MTPLFLAMALQIPPGAQGIVDSAVTDAQRRFGVKPEVIEVERVTWPDGSLGCPQEGMLYTQRTVPGWRIVLGSGGRRFSYHAAERGNAFHCPAERAQRGGPPLPDSTK